MKELYDAVREACAPGIWARGIAVSRREGAIALETEDDAHVVLRVRDSARPIARRVELFLVGLDWVCECPAQEDVCEHVAAATIAVYQARKAGSALPRPEKTAAHVAYAFRRVEGGLGLERRVVTPDGGTAVLAVSLAALVSGRARGPALTPTQPDLTVDRLLTGLAGSRVARDVLVDVVRALAGNAHVTLDDAPMPLAAESVMPRAWVEDDGDGARMVVDRDPAVTEVPAPGVALVVVGTGVALRPLGETAMTGWRLEKLPLGRRFRRDELAELATRALPELEARLPVDVRTSPGRLPQRARGQKPRIVMDVERGRGTLEVVPLIVYGAPPTARLDGDRLVHLGGDAPVRDERAERVLVARLRDSLNLVPGRRVRFEGPESLRFADALRRFGAELGTTAGEPLYRAGKLVPRMVGGMDVLFELDGPGGARVTGSAVAAAWRDGLDVVPLDDGSWVPLPRDWLDLHGHLLADLMAARDDQGKLPAAALPVAAELCEALDAPPPPELERLRPLLAGFESLPPAVLPEDLRAELRPYQRTCVAWLQFLARAGLGGVLADDMGLGKTLQTLCAMSGRTLVVCPASVVHNWADELARFRPGVRYLIHHGAARELDDDAEVVLTTYAILRIDVEELAARRWGTVVLDEAQNIKNPDSQAARAAFRLEADFRVALSGTPVENRLEELWSLLHFTNRGLLGGRRDFLERYARPIADGDAGAAARLRARIRPFVLRRMKRDVAPELPPRTDVVLHCELTERERAVYDAVRASTQAEVVQALAAGGGGGVMAALEALLRLRQAACHIDLVPGQQADSSSKVERLLAALEQAASDGHKALVFSQWTGLLDRVEPHLVAAGIAFTRLDGSTRDRGAVVAAFQDPAGPPVMLVSLKAGGTGLNLTEADHVFLLDPWWNPAVEDQAADRAHRIGQTRPVLVYRLVSRGTVEERVVALGERKRSLADAALGDAAAAATLTRADLLSLLE